MNNVKWLLLFAVSAYLIEVSYTLFDYGPKEFAIQRYIRSRNWKANRTLDPITEFNQVLDFVALVNQFGYPAEEHVLTTVDGYILRLHRIPGSPKSPKAKDKPVVYFQHGVIASSDTWIFRGPDKDFAYILADAGYDVWIGNVRGNTYSREHVSLSPDKDAQFWDFNWHEIALYDVSAIIDYILMETGRKRLIYIGHSMGTTISYVLLSTKPEYNEYIDLVISLAPVAIWQDRPSFQLQLPLDIIELIKFFIKIFRIYEMLPLTDADWQLGKLGCTGKSLLKPICLTVIYTIFGYNPKDVNTTLVPWYFTHFPAGTSVKTLLHYAQNVMSGKFQMYDYGSINNFRKYRSLTAPLYNLSNIVAPVALFYSSELDYLATPNNSLALARKLPNVVTIEAVPDRHFTHLDFVVGVHLKTLLLDRLMEVINKTVQY